jgi:NDP-sugar pyrophosphorylase family protein
VNLGAVIVIPACSAGRAANEGMFLAEPLSCVQIAGRSITERMVERYLASGVEIVSVLVEAGVARHISPFQIASTRVRVQVIGTDVSAAIAQTLHNYAERGAEHSFVNWADTYSETDLFDLLCFHRAARQEVTRAFDSRGPLALWVVDCARSQRFDIESVMEKAGRDGTSYFVREYGTRFAHPRDLRQFAADMLQGNCESSPYGHEIRPGIWLDAGAEVHRRARIVAPAYIGSGSKVLADTLITRLSSIERDCFIDCGTVIENSSILADTHIGIWLDVCHAVVRGNRMLSLGRDVMIEIPDPSLMRSTVSSSAPVVCDRARSEGQGPVVNSQEPTPMPDAWRFGASLIQE